MNYCSIIKAQASELFQPNYLIYRFQTLTNNNKGYVSLIISAVLIYPRIFSIYFILIGKSINQ